jgi:hypothetical protein
MMAAYGALRNAEITKQGSLEKVEATVLTPDKRYCYGVL